MRASRSTRDYAHRLLLIVLFWEILPALFKRNVLARSLCSLVAGGRAKSVSDATLDETSTPAGTTRPPEDQSGPEGGEGAQESVRDADDENVSQSEEGNTVKPV